MRKILFIQLPLSDHGNNYLAGNIPYAAAVLTAYINSRHRNTGKAEYIPIEFSNFASNRVIAEYIAKINPDAAAFVCYLWNIERNLEIVKILRDILHFSNHILFGGPEISGDSVFLSEPGVSFFFSGEGEWFFARYLTDRMIDAEGIFVKQPEEDQISVDEIVEPFTGNYLNRSFDCSVFIEMTRGCPYKCVYCSYSKNLKKVRELDPAILLQSVEKAVSRGIREIYILSPTFDKAPHFETTLKHLSQNSVVQLHTELRTDKIDREKALMIRQAGFSSLEVGIQTLSKEALSISGRLDRSENELRGIHFLKEAGVSLKIGIIPGLPGDTPQSFLSTIDRLCSEGLQDEIELYPLMVLPGTAIRKMTDKYSIAFMNKPPYYQLSNCNFSEDDIQMSKNLIEKRTGLYSVSDIRPDFFHHKEALLCKGVYLSTEDKDWLSQFEQVSMDSYVFSIYIRTDSIDLINPLLKRLIPIDKLYNIVLFSDSLFDDDQLTAFLGETESDSFYRRIHHFDDWLRGTRIMFHQVVSSSSSYKGIFEHNSVIEPLLYVDSLSEISCNDEPFSVLVSPGMEESSFNHIVEAYADYPEMIRFLKYESYLRFTKEAEIQNIKPDSWFSIRNYDRMLKELFS